MPYSVLLITALLLNIPCGYIREGYPKFSSKWIQWNVFPLVATILIAIQSKASFGILSLIFLAAVLGQTLAARIKKNKMSIEEKETIEQIPTLTQDHCTVSKDEDTEVVLFNMGGPRTNADVKEFQKHLFEDAHLIRFPLSFLLQKFFAWLIISLRLKVVEERYRELGEKEGGSPIYRSTVNQVAAVQKELNRRGRKLSVSYSFNYSPPYPKDTIIDLKNRNKKNVLPISLYPHYSKATTGSNLFYLKKEAKSLYPQLNFINSPAYYLHDGYIQAFVDRIFETLQSDESLNDFYLIFSAHGLPMYFLSEGDPYPFQITQTVTKILTKLNRTQHWTISYQSAVGPFEWLKPSTDEIIKALARRSIKKLLIVPVAFVGDHIETICEIDKEYREFALKLGITDYRMSKAIECHPGFIDALADTVNLALSERQQTQKTLTSKEILHV